jgi:hypothetical protein
MILKGSNALREYSTHINEQNSRSQHSYRNNYLLRYGRVLHFTGYSDNLDRLYGLVVRVPDYRPRGPGFDSRRCQIF